MNAWPKLAVAEWRDTYQTLLLYGQIVGKIRLALTPKMNQWWNVALYVTTRGLTTGPMDLGDRTLSIDFDFVDHRLVLAASDGQLRAVPLVPRRVCDFHRALFAELAAMGVTIEIHTAPQECPVTTPLDEDTEHASYDRDRAHDFWRTLSRVEPIFQRFRAGFRGKSSPVHFFWGAFDLAVSRFNGKRAPLRSSKVDRDAYDEEVISLGFWPGDPWGGASEAVFYAYAVPEPAGYRAAAVRPATAFFSDQLKEFLLPYEEVRRSSNPAEAILEFAESTYDVGSKLAGWNRAALAYP